MDFSVYFYAFGGANFVAAVDGYARVVFGEVSFFLPACQKEWQTDCHNVVSLF
jgi:hypothetical protein